MTPRWISRRGFLASAPKAVDDSKPTRIKIAIVDWSRILEKLCGKTIELATGWYHPAAATPSGFFTRNRIARILKTTSEVSWITLITMLAVVEPLIPRTAIRPTRAE